jgi:DNA-directed RNA polymerase specialized sigma24 family protein
MAAAALGLERNRELLSEAIVDVLRSWPDLHRRIFIQSHYRGETIEQVSSSLNVDTSDVRVILDHCDRLLRTALKGFRDSAPERSCNLQTVGFASNGCFH